MASNAQHPDFLVGQTSPALRMAHAKAMAAAAIHQAGGRFYFAELCEKRAADILAVLDSRVEAA